MQTTPNKQSDFKSGCKVFLIVASASLLLIGCDLDRIEDGGMVDDECLDPSMYLFESSLQAGILDSATAIVKSDSGHYFITGYTEKQGSQLLLYKTNLCQDDLLYLGLGSDMIANTKSDLTTAPNGDIIVAGTRMQFLQDPTGYLARVSSAGTIVDVWNDLLDQGLKFYSVRPTSAGGYVVGGGIITEGQFGSDTENGHIMLMSENFGSSVSVHFPAAFSSSIYDAVELSGGKFVGVGTTWIGFGNRILFAQTNTNGDVLLNTSKSFNGIGGDNSVYGVCATATADGNVVIAGYYYLLSTDNATFTMKLSPGGSLIWEHEYPNQVMEIIDHHRPSSIIQTSDGGYAVVGTHKYLNPNPDVFLLKLDANGEYEWDRSYGGGSVEYGTDVIEESDGGFVVTGYTQSFNDVGETGRIFIVKTDSNGHVN